MKYDMREWTTMFRILAQGPDAAVETRLERSIANARLIADVY
ncbi:MAG: hypothetical protein VW999_15710 [Alphaproteobacteria bacterium]